MILFRNCPKCDGQITYNRIYELNRANRSNSLCKSCNSKYNKAIKRVQKEQTDIIIGDIKIIKIGKHEVMVDKDLKLPDKTYLRVTKDKRKNRNGYYVHIITYGSPKRIVSSLHRYVMGLSKEDTRKVDHYDCDGLNNCKYNLRFCTVQQNDMNFQKQLNCSSKYKGVYWDTNNRVWRAHIQINYKHINLGSFKIEEDAAKAYDVKAKELFNEFAKTNF